jgi:hypothetical protein
VATRVPSFRDRSSVVRAFSAHLPGRQGFTPTGAVLLRTMAGLDVPTEIHLLASLMPRQMGLDLSEEE